MLPILVALSNGGAKAVPKSQNDVKAPVKLFRANRILLKDDICPPLPDKSDPTILLKHFACGLQSWQLQIEITQA
jgi:hypothetical protein